MKVVLDTNVWISSLLLPKSNPGVIVAAWQKGLFDIVTSVSILDEIKKVLNYPKIKKRLSISVDELEEYFALLHFFTEILEDDVSDHAPVKKLRDINDGHILKALIGSKANYLITGDEDLLVLRDEYPIITPSEFVKSQNLDF